MGNMNDIFVREVTDREEDKRLWQEYILHHPYSTAYHSIAWRSIFENSFGYRSWYLLAQEGSDGRIVGCLPIFLVSSPLSRRLVSVPFRDRGGPLWDTQAAFNILLEKAKRISEEVNASFLELKSLRAYPSDLIHLHGLQERFYWIHSYVSLRDINMEVFLEKIGPKTRNMLRQAEKAALTFEDATDLSDGVNEWYKLHLVTQKNLGVPPFSLKFFNNMVLELCKTNEIKIFLVRQSNNCLAATIILLHKKSGIYGYSASDPAAQCFRPNDFMIFNSIKWLIDNGFEEFDMGSDSPTQESLLFFKRKWLVRQDTIPTYTCDDASNWISDSSSSHYDLIRKCFRYLPVGLSRIIGGMTTKYFG